MKSDSISTKEVERFSLPKSLIVEGSDDKNFIINFLKFLKIDNKIYIHEVGGNGNLGSKTEKSLLIAAKTPAFKNNVKNLAILFDGDVDENKALRKILSDIVKINNESPNSQFVVSNKINQIDLEFKTSEEGSGEIKTFVFIFKNNLEQVYLETLSEEEKIVVENCIPNFFQCSKTIKTNNKKIVQAFLSTKNEIRDIGAAAGKKIINFDHSSLDNLKKFLLDFANLT